MTYSSGGFDWSSLWLCSWLSIIHFPILFPVSVFFFFLLWAWSRIVVFPSLGPITPPCSPFILEYFNWLDVTDYIHSDPLNSVWLQESEGSDPLLRWGRAMVRLWLSSIMDLEGKEAVMILVQWLAVCLLGLDYTFAENYFREPHSSGVFEKLWCCGAIMP